MLADILGAVSDILLGAFVGGLFPLLSLVARLVAKIKMARLEAEMLTKESELELRLAKENNKYIQDIAKLRTYEAETSDRKSARKGDKPLDLGGFKPGNILGAIGFCLNVLRALPRPLIALGTFCLVAFCVGVSLSELSSTGFTSAIPDDLEGIFGVVVAFYFGFRHGEKTGA